MNKTFLFPYKDGSASAKALAQGLGIKRIRRTGSRFSPSSKKTVINWGCSDYTDEVYRCGRVLNDEDAVKEATNKLSFFKLMDEYDLNDLVVPWTTSPDKALDWLAEGKRVVCRRTLTGHSGEGIEIIKGEHAELPIVPLYTLYTPKKHEYRIHCYRNSSDGKSSVFDVQQKKRKTDVHDDNVDWQVRNLNGGFIYARNDIDVPSCVTDVALKVFEATGLDFGAVDIIYSQKHDRAYALEVNTAPGLSGTTLDKYVEMFKEMLA